MNQSFPPNNNIYQTGNYIPIQQMQQQFIPMPTINQNFPQYQYLQPQMVSPNNFFPQQQFQIQQPQMQQQFIPLQTIPVFPFPVQTNMQYAYQQPIYIQLPYQQGNYIEMQPMGNSTLQQQQIQQRNPQMINNHPIQQVNPIYIGNQTNNLLENQDIQKRCSNCGIYYKQIDNSMNSCRFHPGKFTSSTKMSALSKWSCCRDFDKNSKGCKVQSHLEDKKTSAILSKFGMNSLQQRDNTSSTLNNLNDNNINFQNFELPSQSLNNESSSEGTKEGILIDLPQIFPSSNNSVPPPSQKDLQHLNHLLDQQSNQDLPKVTRDQHGYYIFDHQVQLDDTLSGIALYYRTTVNEIKFLNNLFSNDVFLKKTLKIRTKFAPEKLKPHLEETREHKELRLIRRFIIFTNAKVEEAKFYLSNNNWDVNTAVSEFKSDLSWESNVQNRDQQIKKVSKRFF